MRAAHLSKMHAYEIYTCEIHACEAYAYKIYTRERGSRGACERGILVRCTSIRYTPCERSLRADTLITFTDVQLLRGMHLEARILDRHTSLTGIYLTGVQLL
jgi:hypothetical protein